MTGVAIRAEGLGKRYRIGLIEQRPDTLLGTAMSWLASPLENYRRLRRLSRFDAGEDAPDIIWALRDVSFDVSHGEVLGLIGRNGAGKSTLLKVLSRITEPSAGRAVIQGRVASLLEVGTGFHPELTGRENVYLNATVLGMSKAEVDRKFDEIVAFAEVATFIDTPVKRYSSGMTVRLAFAVAAHLEPEILLVDEVLAVGDAAFQRKCLGKMQDIAGEGRTVLFVSHNLGSVRQLCDRCLLLEGGRVEADGDPSAVIDEYLNRTVAMAGAVLVPGPDSRRSGTGEGRIVEASIVDGAGQASGVLGVGEPFSVRMRIRLPSGSRRLVIGAEVKQSNGLPVLNLRSDGQGVVLEAVASDGPQTFEIRVPALPLFPGYYLVEPWIAIRNGKRLDQLHEGLGMTLECRGKYEAERLIQAGRAVLLADCEYRKMEREGVDES
ncbi:MAG: ABC transporter ATP-binding protein [Acidobacteriota bacterium]